MPLYLAPYIGAGTRADPFRPRGSAVPGWRAIDLRPDPTVRTGRALIWLPIHDTDTQLDRLADDPAEPFGALVRTRIAQRTGIADAVDVRDLARKIFFGTQRAGLCKPVQANRFGVKRVTLGRFVLARESTGIRSGFDIDPTDDFNRSDETPLGGDWTQLAGGGNVNLVSNRIQPSAFDDCIAYYNAETPPDDQFSELTPITSDGGGPACRVSTTQVTLYAIDAGGDDLIKFVNGSFSIIDTLAVNPTTNDVLRVIADGSTISANVNEAEQGSATDTSIASGMWGVWLYSGAFDNWQGGSLDAGDVTGSGALSSGAATADGTGTSLSTGSGSLSAQASAVEGAGTSSSVGSGVLAAALAAVVGAGVSLSTGTGALAALAATVVGRDSLGFGAAVKRWMFRRRRRR